MRFWSSFHNYSLEIVSHDSRKLVFRAPDCIRVQLTADHLESQSNASSCLTHYNHDTCLWECFHVPHASGHHRLFIWAIDTKTDDQWTTAVRFDIYVKEKRESFYFPLTTNLFNAIRCQIIKPLHGVLYRDRTSTEILIRVPSIRDLHVQIDQETLVQGYHFYRDIYKAIIRGPLPAHVTHVIVMGLCFDQVYYSTLVTYRVE